VQGLRCRVQVWGAGTATTKVQCDSASSLLSVHLGLGLKVSGFRVSGCRVQGFRGQGAGFKVLGCRVWVSGVGCRGQGSGFQGERGRVQVRGAGSRDLRPPTSRAPTGLAFRAHRFCVSLDSGLESNKEAEVLRVFAPLGASGLESSV
jgi:hypothetical protein